MTVTDAPTLLWVCARSLTATLHRARVLEMSAALAGLGWRVILASAGVPEREVDGRIGLLFLPRPTSYLVGSLVFHLALLRWLIRDGSDVDVVLFSEDSAPFLLPLVALRGIAQGRTPLMVMDTRTLPMNTHSARERLHARFSGLAHGAANRWADGQTVITERLARAIGVPERQLLSIWPSGVNPLRFAAVAGQRQWPGPEDPLRLVYVGSLHRERNLLALCQAVLMSGEEGLGVTLQLVGDGPQRAELEAYARQRGGDAISVGPRVPYADVPKVLAGADVGVLPFPDAQKFRVSSPLKLFEYLASGMPILATRIVCHTDVLGSHDCIFWAEDASPNALKAAIRLACTRKGELGQMGRRSLVLSQAWTWERSARRLDEALRRLCQERRQQCLRGPRGRPSDVCALSSRQSASPPTKGSSR